MRLLQLPAVLRAQGLRVVEVAGWQDRGRDFTETPVAFIYHHTAESRYAGNAGGLRVVTLGRPGLPGPIANLYLGRDGTVYIVAAGVANNAGRGNARVAGLPAEAENEDTIGFEMANDGVGEPYSPAMYTAAIKAGAAVCNWMGWPAARCLGHKEWSVTGKIDPTWYMPAARVHVASALAAMQAPPPPDPSKEEFMSALTPEEQRNLYEAVTGKAGATVLARETAQLLRQVAEQVTNNVGQPNPQAGKTLAALVRDLHYDGITTGSDNTPAARRYAALAEQVDAVKSTQEEHARLLQEIKTLLTPAPVEPPAAGA